MRIYAYNLTEWCFVNLDRIKECHNVVQLARQISIFDGILNKEVACDQLLRNIIVTCFKSAGIYDFTRRNVCLTPQDEPAEVH